MPDEADPIDQLLDAALYAPLGLLLELRERGPELAARGRQHLQTQIGVARMVGQFAVQMGTKQVNAYLQRQRARPAAEPVPAGAAGPADPTASDVGVREAWPRRLATDGPGADSLAIPGYDTLAASQVVARLGELGADDLVAVRAYEAAHRNRKTILGRIDQLRRAG